MNQPLHLTAAVALLSLGIAPNICGEEPKAGKSRDPAQIETATRLQVFLDRAEFAPGKIDGRYGEFTVKALALYREAHGQSQPAAPAGKEQSKKTDAAPDVTGLDLARIDPVFITYTVTEADLQHIGDAPESVPEQAKLKALPYKNAAEAIAEKFHADVDFLAELNPGKTKSIKAGDELKVPNVEPFELAAVKTLKPGSEVDARGINEIDDEPAPMATAGQSWERKIDRARRRAVDDCGENRRQEQHAHRPRRGETYRRLSSDDRLRANRVARWRLESPRRREDAKLPL